MLQVSFTLLMKCGCDSILVQEEAVVQMFGNAAVGKGNAAKLPSVGL